MQTSQKTIGIAGLGLIGGSLAAAIKKYIPHATVSGYDIEQEEAEKALTTGWIGEVENSFIEIANSVDILFLAAPLSGVLEHIKSLHSISRPMIVSDVAGVKQPVVRAAETLSGDIVFVGGHPIAGSQKSGNMYADPDMFRNAPYVLCPPVTGQIPEELIDIITAVGAHPVSIAPEEHDKVVSKISHAPQLLAVALLNELLKDEDITEVSYKLAGGGFKDVTRIGESSYSIWKDILEKNKKNIISDISTLIVRLGEYKEALQKGELSKIEREFAAARKVRENIGRKEE